MFSRDQPSRLAGRRGERRGKLLRLSAVQRGGIVASIIYAVATFAGSTPHIEKAKFDVGYEAAKSCWVRLNSTDPGFTVQARVCEGIASEAGAAEARSQRLATLARVGGSLAVYWLLGFLAVLTFRWIAAGQGINTPTKR